MFKIYFPKDKRLAHPMSLVHRAVFPSLKSPLIPTGGQWRERNQPSTRHFNHLRAGFIKRVEENFLQILKEPILTLSHIVLCSSCCCDGTNRPKQKHRNSAVWSLAQP